MRVFHGSAIEVKEPEIITGKFTKDFGEGFYCTKLKRQAKRWAMRKETPTVNTYEYTQDKTLSILDFKGMTDSVKSNFFFNNFMKFSFQQISAFCIQHKVGHFCYSL